MGQWVKNRLNFNFMEGHFKFSILAPFFQINFIMNCLNMRESYLDALKYA